MATASGWTWYVSRFVTQLLNLACISRDPYAFFDEQYLINGMAW
jgi:hypothetical protein